jgi:predicted transposase/invertase (TIGR01784 family)
MNNEDKKKVFPTHDTFFRSSLEQLPIARDFFAAHLTQSILFRIKLDTLKLESGTFIDEAHKELRTDILYSVQIDENKGYIFLAIEHQSKPDKLMGFRLLNYACRVWQRYLDQYKGQSKPDKLPVVLPIVIYNGKLRYHQSKALLDCFTEPELLQEFLFGQFTLIDLSIMPNSEIEKHQKAAFMEWLGKNIWARDIVLELKAMNPDIIRSITDLNSGKYLILALKYLTAKSGAEHRELAIEILKEKLPELENDMTTMAQSWIQEGMQQGMQIGAHEKQMEIAKVMLMKGFDIETISELTKLPISEIETLH